MHVHKFEAPSLEEALALVKESLGPEALVLSLREARTGFLRGPCVELTAAVAGTGTVPSPAQSNRYAAIFDGPAATPQTPSAEREWDTLRQTGGDAVPERGPLRTLDAQALAAHPTWAVIGMGGAGKTSVLVKLALRLKAGGARVRLVAGDHRKVAGRAELASYARLAGVEYTALAKVGGGEITLVDTPALTFDDTPDESLAGLCRNARAIVVLDATQRAVDMRRVLDRAASFVAPAAVVFTKCDAASDFEAARDVLAATGLPCLGVSVSPSFREPFRFLGSSELADFISNARGSQA